MAVAAIEKAFASGKKFVMIDAPTGCHAAGTKVIMYNGELRNVEDVIVGDLLMGPDGTPRTVLELCRGKEEMYEISPKKGGKAFVVNGNHILSLKSTNEGQRKQTIGRNPKAKTGNEFCELTVNEYLKKSKYWKHIHKLYRVGVEKFYNNWNKSHKLDPYFLGVLLGDGCITDRVSVTTEDLPIAEEVVKQAEIFDLDIRIDEKQNTYAKDIHLSSGRSNSRKNGVAEVLKFYNLYGKRSGNKFIPSQYKTASENVRLEILAGLIDTDGSLSGANTYEYVTKSKRLSQDVAFIARSLGLRVSVSAKCVNNTEYCRIHISGDTNKIPVRLERKKASPRRQKKDPLVTGFNVEYVGKDYYYGFRLDADHLYLLEDFTVTHNSGKSGIAVAFSRKYKTTIWTPTKFLQEQYATTPEFVFEYTVKGKSNYKCGLPGQDNVPVDEAICCSNKVVDENRGIVPFPLSNGVDKLAQKLRKECAEKDMCPYYSRLYKIGKVPGGTLNYDLGLRIKKQPGKDYATGVEMGNAVVMDEAHQLIQKATSIFGYQLTNTGAMKLFGAQGKRGKKEEVLVWLNRLATLAQVRVSQETDRKKASRFTTFHRRISSFMEFELDNEKKFYIEDRGAEIEIKPLDLRYFKSQLFFPFQQVLLMSATFPTNFCQVLGIKEDEVEIIKMKSTFKPENRRTVFPADIENMNARTILSPESEQIKMMEYILAAHRKDKGIIHCGNYKFFDQLRKIMGHNKRFLWVSQDKNKDEMFYLHKNSKKPTILVSPAMLEGVDLKDDLARFGIMLKVPYAPLDEYTKRMMRIFPQWYENLAITNIVQASGRQVRNENDHAIFYILDGAFKMLLNRHKNLIPRYFGEALKVGDMGRLVKVLNRKIEESKQEG
jgi:hypothetical protein